MSDPVTLSKNTFYFISRFKANSKYNWWRNSIFWVKYHIFWGKLPELDSYHLWIIFMPNWVDTNKIHWIEISFSFFPATLSGRIQRWWLLKLKVFKKTATELKTIVSLTENNCTILNLNYFSSVWIYVGRSIWISISYAKSYWFGDDCFCRWNWLRKLLPSLLV